MQTLRRHPKSNPGTLGNFPKKRFKKSKNYPSETKGKIYANFSRE